VESLILVLTLFVLFVDFHLFLLSLLLLVAYPFVYLAKAAEKFLFVEKKPVEKIVPGDWIVEDVIDKKGKTIYYQDEFTKGVSDYQLSRIRELAKKEHIKSLWVKDGIPFLVPMVLGFIVLLII
jgi:prepilin signal peptidase PulO-like enzyme (type II secretory pathway)